MILYKKMTIDLNKIPLSVVHRICMKYDADLDIEKSRIMIPYMEV